MMTILRTPVMKTPLPPPHSKVLKFGMRVPVSDCDGFKSGGNFGGVDAIDDVDDIYVGGSFFKSTSNPLPYHIVHISSPHMYIYLTYTNISITHTCNRYNIIV